MKKEVSTRSLAVDNSYIYPRFGGMMESSMENVSIVTSTAIIIVLVILVGIGAYVFVVSPGGEEALPPDQAPIVITPEPDLNPAEDIPSLNPAEAANPFEQTYKNPFE